MLGGRYLAGLLAAFAVAAVVAFAGFHGARRPAAPISMDALRSAYGAGTRQIEIAGVSVNYRDEGSGTALVLLHGSFGNLRSFDGMLPDLVDRYRVLRYDQPPAGLSGPVPDDFAMTSEEFLATLLDELGIGRVVLLGTSSGGIIAYRFAANYPERVAALILSNVPPSAPVDNAGALARLSFRLRWSISTCLENGRPWPKTCWRDFLDSNFHRKARVTDALVTEYYDMNRSPGAFVFTSMTAIMREDDEVRRLLAAVRAPTLLLWGSRDPVLPPETAELMASRIGAEHKHLVLFDDVSHYPPLEAPRDVAAAARSWLLELGL
jgi:pimeloyl-ACP methyl ester carboxylesterase